MHCRCMNTDCPQFRKIRVKNSTGIRFNMSSAERQRLHRANLSDVQRVNNRNRDNASRIVARAQLSEQQIEDIRVHNSASRIVARAQLSEQQIEDIRVHNSASRIVARAQFSEQQIEDIRVHNIDSRIVARAQLSEQQIEDIRVHNSALNIFKVPVMITKLVFLCTIIQCFYLKYITLYIVSSDAKKKGKF